MLSSFHHNMILILRLIQEVRAGDFSANLDIKTSSTTFFALFLLVGTVIGYFIGKKKQGRHYRAVIDKEVLEARKYLEINNARLQESIRDLRESQKSMSSELSEIAHDVLQHLRNTIYSLHVSANMIEEQVQGLRMDFIKRTVALLRENQHDLASFFARENKAEMLIEALDEFSKRMDNGQNLAIDELTKINDQILRLNQLVISQKKYMTKNDTEQVDVKSLLTDVLRIQKPTIDEFSIQVIRRIDDTPMVQAPKTKLLSVLNHVIKNATESVTRHNTSDNRLIAVHVLLKTKDRVRIEIQDNGVGISQNNLTRIFARGYSLTNGNGMGLHICANTLADMQGMIGVKSKGEGHGATFVLEFPTHTK